MIGELKKYTPCLMEYVIPYKDFVNNPTTIRELQEDIEDLLFNRKGKEFSKWHGNILTNPQMMVAFDGFKNFKVIMQEERLQGNESSIFKGGYLVKTVTSEITENMPISIETEIGIPIYCDPYMSWNDNRLIFI